MIIGGCRNDLLGILRVKENEVLHWHTDALVDLVESHPLVYHHRIGAMQQQTRIHGIDIVLGSIVHQIGHSDESRHIATGLLG